MVAINEVKLRNISIAYEELGDASEETLIFIHGSAADYRTWAAQMEFFAEKYHVFAYSRRSHYPNPYVPYPTDYSIKMEAEDLVSLITNLTPKAAHLVGWSYGAFIAAMVAKERSHLVRSLVLMEPPIMSFLTANPLTMPLYLYYQMNAKGVKEVLAAGNSQEAVKRFIDAASGTGAFERTPPELQKRMFQNANTLYELTSAERDPFNCEDAAAIEAPTLLLSGEKSPVFLQEIIKDLADCLPKKEYVTIKNAGHPMHSQNAPEYNRVVLDFLIGH